MIGIMKPWIGGLLIGAFWLSEPLLGVSITFSVKLSSVLPADSFAQVRTDRTGVDDLPLEKDPKDATIWRGTFDFDPTRFLLYRFWVVTGQGRQSAVGEGDPGRVTYMTNDVIMLPLARFNVLRDSLQNTVTFQIDMREASATGHFDPVNEQIGLSGQRVDDNP